MKKEDETVKFLSMKASDLLAQFKTPPSGLSSHEVKRRLLTYGFNEISAKKKRHILLEFISHLNSPFNLILLGAGLIAGLLGEVVDTIIICAMVFLGAILDFYQESKAEKAALMLKEKILTTTTVIRDGFKKEIRISDIVPGDIIQLSAGEVVPADAALISAKDLYINQSALTGESFPVKKSVTKPRRKELILTEWPNCLFMGTAVVSGTGTAIVLKTGANSEYGKIAESLVSKESESEFEKGLKRFGYLIMKVSIILVLFVFLINILYQRNIFVSFLFAVALAVGLIPELLPMIVSVNLAKGALLMSKKGVIVKRMASIQNIGSMDVLCADKTGTLTENRIELILHINIEGRNDEQVLLYSVLNSYYQTGLKSPLDDAILEFKSSSIDSYKKLDEIPFDFVRKRVSVVVKQGKESFVISKGAPEEVIKICTFCKSKGRIVKFSADLKKKVEQRFNSLSADGYRVLAVAYKKTSKSRFSVSDEHTMIFVGFIAFIDPPKKSAKESLKRMAEHGVELKILTGDNELVTRKLCKELGFTIKGIVSGIDISRMTDDDLSAAVEKSNVFVRVTPDQKDKIMITLKKNNHVVGFIGDGINDAPSLKTADVGISVDNATDVAKESADIILSRKSLSVLQEGVLEGRKTFGNIMKYIMMGTSSNFGNMFSVAGASLFLPFLPMLPLQILLNNFLYDISEITIPTDEVDREYIQKPKKWDVNFIKKFMLYLGPVSSIFDFLCFFILLYFFHANAALFQTAWFIESLCTQTLIIFVIRTRKTPFFKSKPSTPLLISSLAVILLTVLMPFTALGSLFKFVAPPLSLYAVIAGLIVMYLIITEYVKNKFYSKNPI
jgi:P-type Mg2+ transporter